MFLGTLAGSLLAAPLAVRAQQTTRIYRVGVALEGGPYYAMIDGLKAGLGELGFGEGKHYALLIRDVMGDVGALDGAAKNLEQDNVDLNLRPEGGGPTWPRPSTMRRPAIGRRPRDNPTSGSRGGADSWTVSRPKARPSRLPRLAERGGSSRPGSTQEQEAASLAQEPPRSHPTRAPKEMMPLEERRPSRWP